MKGRNIPLLIAKFFEGGASEETRRRFGRWLTDDDLHNEKQEALLDIWENYTTLSDESTAEELKKVRRRIARHDGRRWRTAVRHCAAAAAAIALLALGSALTRLFTADERDDVATVKEPELVEHFVPRGERRHITLSDGSEVWINSGSLLVYDREFTGSTRTIYLHGEANFSVARNAGKPFVVKTECMDITALGTVFNVQSYPGAVRSTAILESGKVQISMKQHEMHSVVILAPNEQLVYDRNTDEVTTRRVEAAKRMQWTEGYMVFQGNTFDEVVQEIERHFGVAVIYDAARFRGRLFTLRFSPGEDVRQVFDVLREVGDFKYRIRGDAVYVN
ncbi:MAG: FecR domain-containing protein [Tannerella sp.]|jgi:ferric-dicitrate binding protein FerR (iron transport regulator)|nr:FecR domain-containing protein [Tannerella sp.]